MSRMVHSPSDCAVRHCGQAVNIHSSSNDAGASMPVYANAARQRLGGPDTPVEAAYWFVRKSRGTRIGVPLTSRVELTYAQTLEVIVSSMATGLFPGRAPEGPDYTPYRQCEYCNPDGLGHGEARVRWERKRSDPALRRYVELVEPVALETQVDD